MRFIIEHLSKHFEKKEVLRDIDFIFEGGKIYGLLGRNGAGKTTLFNCITGIYHPAEGTVRMLGTDITGWKPHQVTSLGFARTFQNIRLFSKMTVLDNVIVGMHTRTKTDILSAVLNTKAKRREEKACEEKALEILRIFGMEHLKYEMATSLPYGPQRDLEIARALASDPKLLLLDEPAAGMNESETESLDEVKSNPAVIEAYLGKD